MQADSPLLTIAIPTYNRSRCLSALLDSLQPQLVHEPSVELLVSDNASPDSTPTIVEQYRESGLALRYLRNPVNMGADSNIAQCFAEARGRYVWIVGDDDVLLPGALAVILNLLTRNVYDLVHMRAQSLTGSRHLPSISHSPKMEEIYDARTFALRTHVYLTFITGNIVNKERVSSLPHPPFADLIGTSLVQLGWTYTALAHLRRGAYITTPLVAAGADDRGGYSLYTVFGTNLMWVTATWLQRPELVRIVRNGTLQTFFPFFVLQSKLKQGAFLDEAPQDILKGLFQGNFRYYLFVYPLFRLPGSLGRLWLLFCRVINRLNRAAGNVLLR